MRWEEEPGLGALKYMIGKFQPFLAISCFASSPLASQTTQTKSRNSERSRLARACFPISSSRSFVAMTTASDADIQSASRSRDDVSMTLYLGTKSAAGRASHQSAERAGHASLKVSVAAEAPTLTPPNGDVLRLREENFVKKDERHYLNYTPHKTELSSGRRVYWPIHEDIWRKFEDYGGVQCLDVTEETFDDINRELRMLGFRGSKGAYELRKICIDHVYQRFGAEIAVSLSGDDIKTITRYYADPAQPNIGTVRVLDLL